MQVHQRVAVKPRRVRVVHQQLNGGFVIHDHLRFKGRLALCRLTVFDQLPRIEPGIGIALQMARRPGQVNQQPVQNRSAVGARRRVGVARRAHLAQLTAQRRRQIPRHVGLVSRQKIKLIAHRLARLQRLIHVGQNVVAIG